MKSTTTMIAITTVAIALTAASAADVQAICVFDKPQCGGKVRLREYTPVGTCRSDGNCGALALGAAATTTFSTLPTCATDHVKDTAKHMGGQSYVIVDTFDTAAKCNGDFQSAMAVAADDTCYPSSDGKRGFRVVLRDDMGGSWSQFADAACTAPATKTLSFNGTQVDRSECVEGTMRVYAVRAGAPAPTTAATPGAAASGATNSLRGGFVSSAVATVVTATAMWATAAQCCL